MSKYLLVILLLLPGISSAIDFDEAVSLAAQQFKEKNQSRVDYLIERMEYENSISLDEQGDCYSIPGGGITQVIRINKEGIIDLVLSSASNAKSECFRKVYLGTKYKRPPIAPIYQKMLMGYGIEPPAQKP
ncbi:hypothetical protein ACJJIL_00945 [Microbulbifer sp. EKSA005]|uniref:hypothetical protein n=1 Tax=Microbulbifer sp. EKSA005 TaxID=3243364 RepID=UPI0040417429